MERLDPPLESPRPTSAIRNWVAVLSAIIFLTVGCAADVNVRGNTVDQAKLAQIKPGVLDRSGVRELLGSPTNVATFNAETWYYISQKDRAIAFSKPQPLTRNVVAISFNDAGRVAKVKKYSLADARKIEPTNRKTPTPGQELSLIQQLIGNIGRFEQSTSEEGGL